MKTINIKATDETPSVILDAKNNTFEIEGKSLPEDVTTFYSPILDWLNEFSLTRTSAVKFTFKMDYFNTASSKLILDILIKLEEINEKIGTVSVEWLYREEDEDMEEAGEEYAEIVNLPFEIKSY